MAHCKPKTINIRGPLETNIERVNRNPVYVNPDGSISLDQVAVLEKQFKDNILADVSNTALARYIKNYGESVVFDSVKGLNRFLKASDVSQYPLLQERLNLDQPITALEATEFYQDNLYNPTSIEQAYQQDPNKVLKQLNSYYNGSWITSIMGGFCSILGNVFAAAAAVFALIEKVQAIISAIEAIVKKIRNAEDPIKALFEAIKVKALIEAIKEKILAAVCAVIQTVRDAISAFKLDSIFQNEEEKPVKTNARVLENGQRLKENATETLKEENEKKICDKVEGIIDFSVGQISNPSVEQILTLVFRICGFAGTIEEIVNKVKEPLQRFADDYEETGRVIESNSAQATADAVQEGGAIRYSDEVRVEGINSFRQRCQEASRNAAAERESEIPAGEVDIDPPAGNPMPPSAEEVDGIPSWEDIWNGRSSRLSFGQGLGPNRMGSEGWNRVTVSTRTRLLRCQEEFGKRLQINSAYRSPAYNQALRDAGVNAARNSKHMQGTAFDITWPGFNTEEMYEFAAIARRNGLVGIGYYDSFIHCDEGPQRSWDTR